MEPVLDPGACRVFFDGTLTEPRLDHPESVAIHADGSVWCGGEFGQIYRIAPDGSAIEEVASTGGFCLGLAFDADWNLFACDLKHAAVMRLDARTGTVGRFAEGAAGRRFRIPNFPAFDPVGRLYVSDSNGFKEPGPGIYRFEPDGSGTLWYGREIDFANGIAFSPDGAFLYVAETFSSSIFRIPIEDDGSPGERENVLHLPGVLPDGLAFDVEGNLYVGCYEPSQILRVAADGAECLARDEEAHLLCHPTNVAFRGTTLFASNLGRWHITAIDVGREGAPLGR